MNLIPAPRREAIHEAALTMAANGVPQPAAVSILTDSCGDVAAEVATAMVQGGGAAVAAMGYPSGPLISLFADAAGKAVDGIIEALVRPEVKAIVEAAYHQHAANQQDQERARIRSARRERMLAASRARFPGPGNLRDGVGPAARPSDA